MWFDVVIESSYTCTLSSVVHTVNIEKKPFVKLSRSDRVGSLTTTGRLIKRGFRYRVLTGKLLLFWIGRRLW